MKHLSLGASLYVPATHKDLTAIANGHKYSWLRSAILCTEDAVLESDLALALDNLAVALRNLTPSPLRRFIRVRNPRVMGAVLQMPGIEHIEGFVLPKINQHNLDSYVSLLDHDSSFLLMPTLETRDVFDHNEMLALRALMEGNGYRSRILVLRIGGNDLLRLMGLRRPKGHTIYDTALGSVIASLTTIFIPAGFPLSAPVFEFMDRPELLAEEVSRDIAHGLITKTAIHPLQVEPIETMYRADAQDVEMAEAILSESAPAVFKLHHSMCEVATHDLWAEHIMARKNIFGVSENSADTITPETTPQPAPKAALKSPGHC